MKKHLLLFSTLLFMQVVNAQIKFESQSNSLKVAMQQAQEAQKLIFITLYNAKTTDSKPMFESVFLQSDIGDICNKQFVNLKVSSSSRLGKKLKKAHQIKSNLTYLFLDAQGNLLHSDNMSMSDIAFKNLCKVATDPEKQFFSLKKRFDAGENTPEFLKQMTLAAIKILDGEVAKTAIKKYLLVTNYDITKESATMLYKTLATNFVTQYDKELNLFVLKNQEAFITHLGKSKTYAIIDALYDALQKSCATDDKPIAKIDIAKAKIALQDYPKDFQEMMIAQFQIYNLKYPYSARGTRYNEAMLGFLGQYATQYPRFISYYTFPILFQNSNKTQLETALNYILRGYEKTPDEVNLLHAVVILVRLERQEDARKYAELYMAQNNNKTDFADVNDLLQKANTMY